MKTANTFSFCPHCGGGMEPAWSFCPSCSKAAPPAMRPEGPALQEGAALVAGASAVPAQQGLRAGLQEAQTHLRRKEFILAAQRLDALLLEHPDQPEALALLGMVRLQQCKVEEGQSLLERAIELAPASPFVHLRMAEYWLGLGITRKGQEELNRALLAAADDPVAYESIRAVVQEVREKTRWSFEHSAPAPPLQGIAAALKHPFRFLKAGGKQHPTLPVREEH